MGMVGKQFSPFMEMVDKQSHGLWSCSGKQSSSLATTVLLELLSVLLELLRVGKQFLWFLELLQQEVQEL
jgi:hypothetical protein